MIGALGVWLLISAYMLVILGEELDMDSVFYGYSGATGRTVIHGPTYVPPPENPPLAVVLRSGLWELSSGFLPRFRSDGSRSLYMEARSSPGSCLQVPFCA